MTGWTVGMDCRASNRNQRLVSIFSSSARKEERKQETHSIRIPHHSPGDNPSLNNHLRSHAKECGIPQHQIGEFPRFDVPDDVRDSVSDGRVDGVFGDVALRASR
jgi:hypothetical protein